MTPYNGANVCSRHFTRGCFRTKSERGTKILRQILVPKAFPTKRMGRANRYLKHRKFSLQEDPAAQIPEEEVQEDQGPMPDPLGPVTDGPSSASSEQTLKPELSVPKPSGTLSILYKNKEILRLDLDKQFSNVLMSES